MLGHFRRCRFARRALACCAIGVIGLAVATPGRADPDDWQHRHHRHHRHHHERETVVVAPPPAVVYGPPPVVYAPPPAVYAPPPQVNVVVPLRF